MAYQLVKQPDGDLSLGNLRGELVNLLPASSDYPLGGYLVQGEAGATESTGNVGLAKVIFIIPIGGQAGYSPVFNPVTSKVEVFQDSTAQGPGGRVLPGTDLSAFSFGLLVVGL